MSIHAHADHEAAIKHAEHVSAQRERIGLTALGERERVMIAGGFEDGASYGRKQAMPKDEREILAALQAYFPQAQTLHEAYRAIEALEEALERIGGFTLSQFMGSNDMALECGNVARAAIAKAKAGAA